MHDLIDIIFSTTVWMEGDRNCVIGNGNSPKQKL